MTKYACCMNKCNCLIKYIYTKNETKSYKNKVLYCKC